MKTTSSAKSIGFICFPILLWSCGLANNRSNPPAPLIDQVGSSEKSKLPSGEDSKSSKEVKASFYGKGDGFAGKKTASGEIFNPNDLTAAHKTLPFNTIVEVTNPTTGQSVDVRVNDRGPYSPNRKIDISAAAAKKVGLDKQGVGNVNMRVKK